MNINSICVFCGSCPGKQAEYLAEAQRLGQLMAKDSVRLVFGGGAVGLMGGIADSVLQHGGEALGIIPHGLKVREVAHQKLTELKVVNSMHERKALMADSCDAFIAMPGGYGTLEELFEVMTWAQLGIHSKPIGLLNTNGFYDSLIQLIDHCEEEGFVREQHYQFIVHSNDPEELLELLKKHNPPKVEKWLSMDES